MGIKTHELLTFDQTGHYAWLVWCPACDEPHTFDARWEFSGDHEAPTFTGSMLHHEPDKDREKPDVSRCHSLLTDGVWNYCADCTHEHAGKSLPAPDWAATRFGRMRPDGVVPAAELGDLN
jgi:hypothetical protein